MAVVDDMSQLKSYSFDVLDIEVDVTELAIPDAV